MPEIPWIWDYPMIRGLLRCILSTVFFLVTCKVRWLKQWRIQWRNGIKRAFGTSWNRRMPSLKSAHGSRLEWWRPKSIPSVGGTSWGLPRPGWFRKAINDLDKKIDEHHKKALRKKSNQAPEVFCDESEFLSAAFFAPHSYISYIPN